MLALHPGTASSDTDVLARKTSANDIDGNPIGSERCFGEFSDISINRNLGPMLVQDADSEWLDLAEGDRLEPTRAFQAQIEAANACEERQHAQWD
jgi:hypothetical protein